MRRPYVEHRDPFPGAQPDGDMARDLHLGVDATDLLLAARADGGATASNYAKRWSGATWAEIGGPVDDPTTRDTAPSRAGAFSDSASTGTPGENR